MSDSCSIHIGHLNVYHLCNKTPDLYVLLSQPNPFHLFGFTETRLNSSISDDVISIPEFSIIRRDPQSHTHTGIAVYIHNSLKDITRRRPDLESDTVESVWVEIKNKSSPVLVGFIYRNPSAPNVWLDDFTDMLDNVKHCTSDVLLLGDFNINMFSANPTWESTITLFGLKQLITSPTRVTSTSSTLIDHIYTTNKNRVLGTDVPQVGISDHYPVCCNWALKSDKPIRKHQHTTIKYRSLKHFNNEAFLFDLSLVSFDDVYQHCEPNGALSEWYRLFLSVLDKHAPIREKRVKNPQLPLWLNKGLVDAMELRDELKRKKDFPAYRKQRNLVKKLVLDAKKSLFKRIMNGKKDTVSVWRALNAFTKSKYSPTCTSISAETFNNHFLSAAESLLQNTTQKPPSVSPNLVKYCDSKLPSHSSFHIPFMSVHDVGKAIESLKSKRTSGHDGISTAVLKLSLPFIVEPLTFIYNLCIERGEFPSDLKKAKVIPLPKSKDLTDPNKFRPISILSSLSKPIEKHIHRHLQLFLDTHNLIHPLQSGFRPRHSCQTALSHLTDRWLTTINKSLLTGVVFLDFSKAFDLVNHTLLIQKLSVYRVSDQAVSFFKSYLECRRQHVSVNGKSSPEGLIMHGVPQGSILGPLLFTLYINDLPLHISQPDVTCSLFADDATLDVSAPDVPTISSSLQQAINEVSDWCQTNSMVPNPSKTECMLVTTRQKHQLNPPPLKLSIGQQPITQVREHRLLGVTVDDQLSWHSHTNSLCKVLSKNLFLLSRLVQFTDVSTRQLFYTAHIKSHLDYGSTVWDGCSDITIKRINSLHRRAAKLILKGSHTQLSTDDKLKELNMLPLRKHLLFNKCVFMRKITITKSPGYLAVLFKAPHTPYPTLRNDLVVPRPRLDIFKSSLSYSGAKEWNLLPKELKSIMTINAFKTRLHQHLLRM